MSKTVWHVALEPIEARYSAQWLECIHREFTLYAAHHGYGVMMMDIIGDYEAPNPTAGGFLDFVATNGWKASQVIKITNLFNTGNIKPGDVFLFTDAWNPAILHVKYMSDLMDIPVRIVSYWHAGSYDINDVLGYKIKDRRWSYHAESAFFYASDVNVFATQFHKEFFKNWALMGNTGQDDRMLVSGQPHYEILKWFDDPKNCNPSWDDRENWILFPHRMAPEKQPDLFEQLSDLLPQYEFIFTQGQNLSKDDYYRLMQKCKVVVSFAKHEMLGISMMEGVLAGCIPLVPYRLSYKEMYLPSFQYPTDASVNQIAEYVVDMIERPTHYLANVKKMAMYQRANYLTCKPLWKALLEENETSPSN
jgi:hypothetical protein